MPAQRRPLPVWIISAAIAVFVCVVYAFSLAWSLNIAHSRGMTTDAILSESGDAQDYVGLAYTLLDARRYALTPASPPEFFRVPGYPVFIAGVFAVFNSVLAIILMQILLTAGSCVLIFRLGERFFSRGVGLAAALIFALDPTVIFNTLITLSESLFVFLVLLAVYLITATKGGTRRMFLTGLVIGALALTRPVGPFVFPFFLLYFLWTRRSDSGRILLTGSLAFLAGVAILVAPWLARNQHLSGHFSITSASTYNMLFYNVVEYETEVMHIPKEEFRQTLFQSLGSSDTGILRSFAYENEKNALVRDYIGPRLFSYAVFHIVKTAPFFIGSSLNDTERLLINLQLIDRPQKPAVSVSGLVVKGDIRGVLRILRENPFETAERIFWMLIFMFSAGYALHALWSRNPRASEALLFGALAFTFAILVGPIAQTRYRIPAEPFLLLLAFQGMRLCTYKVLELKKRYFSPIKVSAPARAAKSNGTERN